MRRSANTGVKLQFVLAAKTAEHFSGFVIIKAFQFYLRCASAEQRAFVS
jgi:hypothetical protein